MGLVYLPIYTYHKDQPNVGKYTIHGWYVDWLPPVTHWKRIISCRIKQELLESHTRNGQVDYHWSSNISVCSTAIVDCHPTQNPPNNTTFLQPFLMVGKNLGSQDHWILSALVSNWHDLNKWNHFSTTSNVLKITVCHVWGWFLLLHRVCKWIPAQITVWSFGLSPLPVTVTTRIITFLVGDPYKPSFATGTGRGDTQVIIQLFRNSISQNHICFGVLEASGSHVQF